MVKEMFDQIAPTYDVLNHVLSLGIDRGWRRKVVREVARSVQSEGDVRLLDVATGTGDLAIAMAKRLGLGLVRITGVDISEGMLAVGRKKVEAAGLAQRVKLQQGDAQKLGFEDGAFDCVTAAFGVRNFGNLEAGLKEMCRVTKKGGKCLILEFSEPRGAIFGQIYRWYFHRVLPWMGRVVSRDKGAYSYLPRSVGEFPTPEKFSEMMLEGGFSGVDVRKLTGGVAYIYTGEK